MNVDGGLLVNASPASKAVIAVAFAAALSGCAGSQEAPSRAENPIDEARLQEHFRTMDQDGDGFISRPEFQAGRGAVFLAIDKDSSLSLSADEMHLTPEAFAALAGADGVVTTEEFVGSDTASFDQMDTDRDTRLSYDELRAFVLTFGS